MLFREVQPKGREGGRGRGSSIDCGLWAKLRATQHKTNAQQPSHRAAKVDNDRVWIAGLFFEVQNRNSNPNLGQIHPWQLARISWNLPGYHWISMEGWSPASHRGSHPRTPAEGISWKGALWW